MFTGRVEARPCHKFQNKFPNLYLEPMQYNNPDGKWSEDIPYMIINLEHDRAMYLGKDTIVAYAREEDKSCDYLEINEIIELADLKKDLSTKGKSIVKSDLVFSPAQVTEHRCVELKDQEITKETRERFEKLMGKYPKVFSMNSEDIGRTNLVTMHVDTGDNPPICQKLYTLPLKHYSWVQQEIKTLECVGVIKKSISPWASPIVVVPKKSAPGEAPRQRMCMDFQKINELQPKTQRADKQMDTQGNLSLIPLPKIDEMYANLCGAKFFTTLDLRSGYYHITLDNESKATTAATPENRQVKQWTQKPRDSKITLTQESDHYVPTEFSGNFFRKFNLAMKLKCDELKKQGGSSKQVNEITENNFIQAFGVTEDQMEKAAAMLNGSENH